MGLVAAVAAGCQTPSPRGGEPPPAYETLASFHNKRVEMLSRVYARGNVEIRWTDDDGGHFEQGDLDLWIALPDRTAMNITKFSERILWLGSRGKWAWVFDFRGDETVLSCVCHEELIARGDDAGIFMVPQSLLGLCGLTRLPEPSAEHPSVSHDPHSDVLMVTVSRQDGSLRAGRRPRSRAGSAADVPHAHRHRRTRQERLDQDRRPSTDERSRGPIL